jgi:O-antigen/teichoic acid export membrane protein
MADTGFESVRAVTVARPQVSAGQPCAARLNTHPLNLWTICRRFLGYLTGDSLNYALGFLIYAWLIRILSNSQYAQLSIATSLYQTLMMVTAIGIDFIGPSAIRDHFSEAQPLIGQFERTRVGVAFIICLPILSAIAIWYWRQGRYDTAVLIFASFAMVIARAIDLSYVAITYGLPGMLAKSRVLGLAVYLVILLALAGPASRHLWLIPVVNAAGVAIGRMVLKHQLRHKTPQGSARAISPIPTRRILIAGCRSGLGQLIMLGFQTLDIMYLSRYLSASYVGQYAMVERLYIFGTAALTSVFNAFIPNLISGSDPRRGIKWCLRFSAVVGAIGFVGLAFCGPQAAEFMAGRRLPQVHEVAPWFGAAFFLLAIATPIYGVLAVLRREQEYMVAMLVGAVAMASIDVLLVPRYGLLGGALGQVSASFAVLCVSGVFVWRKALPSPADHAEVGSC